MMITMELTTELITRDFVGRIALQFVFMFLVIYLLLNVARIILQTFGLFLPPAPEAPKPPLCTCGSGDGLRHRPTAPDTIGHAVAIITTEWPLEHFP